MLWGLFISALILAVMLVKMVLVAVLPTDWNHSVALAMGVSALVFVSILGVSVYQGWTIVKQNHEYVVEIFGKYTGEPLTPGLSILFPWFNWVVIQCDVSLAQRMVRLYADESKEGGGLLDFKDGSAPVISFITYKVSNSYLATYVSNDLQGNIKEYTDHLLRSYLGQYNIDDLDEMKSSMNLETIAGMCNFCPSVKLTENEIELLKQQATANYENTEYYKSLAAVGIQAVSLVISDIKMTPEVIDLRNKKMKASVEIEVAKLALEKAEVSKQITITEAEAKKAADILEAEAKKTAQVMMGSGHADRIKQMIESGLSAEEVAAIIIKEGQWESIGKGGNHVTVIEGSNNGTALQGAQFGAGFTSNQK